MFSYRKRRHQQISTQQCRQMMQKQFNQIVNGHIINEDQQMLIQNYSNALRNDLVKQSIIKQKLNSKFFNKHKRRNTKNQLRKKFTISQNTDKQIRNRLQKEFKESLNFTKTSRRSIIKTPQPKKSRYDQQIQYDQPVRRPCKRPTLYDSYQQSLSKEKLNYTIKIEDIIEESQRIKSKERRKTRNIMTPSQRKDQVNRQDRIQKEEIIDKIIFNDIDDYLKSCSIQLNQPNPEIKRRIYEDRKKKELNNFDKYNMSFTNYMKQKTTHNIQKTIYNDKIRQKDSYVQKFQKHILDEFKFSEQARRRLEKIFKGIELQFKRPVKNRQISERLSPK